MIRHHSQIAGTDDARPRPHRDAIDARDRWLSARLYRLEQPSGKMIRVRRILNKRAAIRPRLDVAPGTEGALALAGQNDHAAIAVPLGSTYGGHDPVCDLTVEGISIIRTSNRDTHFFAERLRLNNVLSHFRSSPLYSDHRAFLRQVVKSLA